MGPGDGTGVTCSFPTGGMGMALGAPSFDVFGRTN